MKETGKTYAGITFVVVYSPAPSTQVISVQINVDFGVAGSCRMVQCTDRVRFWTYLVCMQCIFQELLHNKGHWPLVGDSVPSWSLFMSYNSSISWGKDVWNWALRAHTFDYFSKSITLLRWYNLHTPWVLGLMDTPQGVHCLQMPEPCTHLCGVFT